MPIDFGQQVARKIGMRPRMRRHFVTGFQEILIPRRKLVLAQIPREFLTQKLRDHRIVKQPDIGRIAFAGRQAERRRKTLEAARKRFGMIPAASSHRRL